MTNLAQKIFAYSTCYVLCSIMFLDVLKAQEMTPLQISTMQSREYEITRRLAFDSAMGMFQDMGYTIDAADWDTGLIKAHTTGREGSAFFKVNEQIEASMFIRSMGEKKVVVRINLHRRAHGEQTGAGTVGSMAIGMIVPFGGWIASEAAREGARDDSVVLDPTVYQSIFEKYENSLFVSE